MTVTSVETRYVQDVAAEVRAMAGRRQITGKQIGQYLGHDEMWASRRMRGSTPWTGADLVRLAGLFKCRPSDLLPYPDDPGTGVIARLPLGHARGLHPLALLRPAV